MPAGLTLLTEFSRLPSNWPLPTSAHWTAHWQSQQQWHLLRACWKIPQDPSQTFQIRICNQSRPQAFVHSRLTSCVLKKLSVCMCVSMYTNESSISQPTQKAFLSESWNSYCSTNIVFDKAHLQCPFLKNRWGGNKYHLLKTTHRKMRSRWLAVIAHGLLCRVF